MSHVISKAQEKRNKDKFNMLSDRMQSRLVDFKNTYIGDFVRYEEHQIERIANAFKGSDMEVVKKNVVGRSIKDVRKEGVFSSVELSLFYCAKHNSCYGYDDRITDIQIGSVERAQRKLELIELQKVEFYSEALKSYDTKFKKLIDGMMKHDFDRNMEIEDVNQQGGHFEILVYNPTKYTSDEQERIELSEFFYHARIIYACGHIVRPHFRFITTTRQTYISK